MSAIISAPQTFSAAEREEILRQLDRLLASPYFSNSRRFPVFLRYIVQETLTGNADLLKERTIGVEIFGKEASYDTSTEPIVRVTAAEIRKRIAQYYQDPGCSGEIRMTLPSGSYVPHFEFAAAQQPLPALRELHTEDAAPPAIGLLPLPSKVTEPAPSATQVPVPRDGRLWRFAWPALAVTALTLLALQFLLDHPRRTPVQQFWEPITASSGHVLVSIPDQTHYDTLALRDAADPTHEVVLHDKLTAVVIDDLNIIGKLTGVLQAASVPYTLRAESATTLSDLREGPSVIIGAFDNEWTLRLTRPLRFQFASAPEMTSFSIVDTKPDTQSSAPHAWTVDRLQQMATNNYTDYAIVARFTDATTGRPTLIAAGIGRGGTTAAGEFLTSPQLLHDALKKQPSRQMENFEAVLSTRIIDGQPGTPVIEDIYFW
ncbi:MAG TPA: hypothetical protein VE291_00600 [Terracidiphilus sp.]|jgi:hypothetical protein|nr:hypothetical protein [Terracidiphilus sp.]